MDNTTRAETLDFSWVDFSYKPISYSEVSNDEINDVSSEVDDVEFERFPGYSIVATATTMMTMHGDTVYCMVRPFTGGYRFIVVGEDTPSADDYLDYMESTGPLTMREFVEFFQRSYMSFFDDLTEEDDVVRDLSADSSFYPQFEAYFKQLKRHYADIK